MYFGNVYHRYDVLQVAKAQTVLTRHVIDEIDYGGKKGSQACLIGGAGTYTALGARLLSGYSPEKVGWIVDVGSDFPPEFRALLESWGTNCLFREDSKRLTTRAWNGYGPNELRGKAVPHSTTSPMFVLTDTALAFKYLTSKIRLDENSLPETHLFAKVFHCVCSPSRCISLVQGILDRRKKIRPAYQELPLFVWEPIPDLCTVAELDNFYTALHKVDVVSPNDTELGAQYGGGDWAFDDNGRMVVNKILQNGIGKKGDGWLVVRAGGQGCYAFSRDARMKLPAYHQDQSKVVDPTGAGNTFLGALGKGLAGNVSSSISQSFEKAGSLGPTQGAMLPALAYASVAASFVVEQPGIPVLTREEKAPEKWNGETFARRLSEYVSRLATRCDITIEDGR